MLENCGISALGVHGRRKEERPKDFNRFEEIREVARTLSIPVIANGESSCISSFDDIAKSKEKCGASSIMIARTALSNPSIFRSEGLLSMEDEIRNFLDKACFFDEDCQHSKYVISRILGGAVSNDERGKSTIQAATMSEICQTWDKADIYNQYQQRFGRTTHKRKIEEDSDGLYKMNVSFPQKRLKTHQGLTPKCYLINYCTESKIRKPVYETMATETGKFISIVDVDRKRYTSTVPQSNKRMAEQVAALTALYGLKVRDKLAGTWD
jgi:tRNA-dihydrouridine synthase 2